MWPFLFILAIIPLAYFWSDSVTTMFPQLAQYLPAKTATANAVGGAAGAASAPVVAEGANLWLESNTASGYVAYALSGDGKYRLAVGCRPGAKPSLQVTTAMGDPVKTAMVVNYRYGTFALSTGAYQGDDLVGGVAQFKDLSLTTTSREVISSFTLDGVKSGAVARTLQSNCAQ